MLSLSRLLCGLRTESDPLRYGHARQGSHGAANDAAPKPVVVWALTRACNLRCVHCYAAASSKPASSELTHAEGRALLEDLRDFGVPAVLFSGGEPLVRHDALDLLDYARGLGLNATLSTNGLLIDDAMADKLADLELKYVGISLDGLKPIHDKLRGQPGAYEETLAAIRRCRERGIKVGLRYTVHALNLDQLDAVFDLCLDLGIQRLCVYHLAYAGRGRSLRRSDLSSECTRAMVERLMRRTIEAHEAGSRMEVLTVANHADAALLLLWFERHLPNSAAAAWQLLRGTGGNRSGCNIASIGPRGTVHYDQFSWHYTVGHVRERPFSWVWTHARDPRLAALRNRRRHLPTRCQACRFLEVCNGNLRTRAESSTGDWLAMDPGCYMRSEETFFDP